MRILAITQARYGSTRLPAKVLKKVNGVTLLENHLRRILQSKLITKLKVATTNEEGAEHITDIAERVGVEWYKGSVFLFNNLIVFIKQLYRKCLIM